MKLTALDMFWEITIFGNFFGGDFAEKIAKVCKYTRERLIVDDKIVYTLFFVAFWKGKGESSSRAGLGFDSHNRP